MDKFWFTKQNSEYEVITDEETKHEENVNIEKEVVSKEETNELEEETNELEENNDVLEEENNDVLEEETNELEEETKKTTLKKSNSTGNLIYKRNLVKSLSIDDRLSLLSNKIDNMNSDLHNYYDGVTIFLWSFVGIFTTIGISYYLC